MIHLRAGNDINKGEGGSMEKLHIVLSTNERYMPGATVALVSLAVQAKSDTDLHFHVFTEDVKPESWNLLVETIMRVHPRSVVENHVCGEDILSGFPVYAGSRMTWVRCFYSRLLPEVDWALYLDCDVLYLASPEEHFSYRDENVYACVAKDMSPNSSAGDIPWARKNCGVELSADRYFNAGIMLFNFRKFREDGIPEKIAAFIREHPDGYYADQTAMNVIFQQMEQQTGKECYKMIPTRFDHLQIYLDDTALSARPVIHYVNGIPWLPKIATVANGRFDLWHAFADKYIWQKKGESCRRLFPYHVLLFKRLEYVLLTTPMLHGLFAFGLMLLGKRRCMKRWEWAMVGSDVSRAAIESAVG